MNTSKLFFAPLIAIGLGLSSNSFADPVKPHSFEADVVLSDNIGLNFAALDMNKISIEDTERQKQRLPYRYAISHDVDLSTSSDFHGKWTTDNGISVLRIPVSAKDAHSLSFGFDDVFLPKGANLYVYDQSGEQVLGPFTEKNHNSSRELWTPVVQGENAFIEVNVPTEMQQYVRFNLSAVNQGYRGFTKSDQLKSGSCNIDVVCASADDWRDEIRSVASFSFTAGGSSFVCTGSMVNNTAEDRKPYFLTANHCVSTAAEVNTMVFYWNYETSTCQGVPDGNRTANSQSGATLLATWDPADMTLVELDASPDESFNVHWAGWDNSNTTPNSAVAIHHPAGDEKRISFDNDALLITEYLEDTATANGTHLRIGEWEEGTTEGGSSGSAIWNANKHIVGTLTGGFASCNATTEPDWYGRVALQWDGGGTAGSQLKAWLDPINSGVTSLNGSDNCTAPTVSFTATPTTDQEVGQAITFTSNVTGGSAQSTYAWDFDGDGVTDSTDASPVYTYSSIYIGDVSLEVSENGCSGSDSQAFVVTHAGGNTPPTASTAANTLTVDEGDMVTLDASSSSDANGDDLTYLWTQTGGTAATLSSTANAAPTFTAPSISANDTLTFTVTVTDVFGDSDEASVSVTVNNVNQAPNAQASASPSTIVEGGSVNLDASGSSDPDGDNLTYSWVQTAGPNATITGADSSTASFVAPQVIAQTTLTFEVTVTDSSGAESSTSVNVTVNNTPTTTPNPGNGGGSSGGGSAGFGLLIMLFLLVLGRTSNRLETSRRDV